MDLQNMDLQGGSLQISTEVIAKIARCAALEVEGVVDKILLNFDRTAGLFHSILYTKLYNIIEIHNLHSIFIFQHNSIICNFLYYSISSSIQ